MKSPQWKSRLLSSTRGRIMSLLRQSNRTVNEIAVALGLADNTVRAHLSSLERDGLIVQTGTTPGTRKPHYAYALTTAGEWLFLESCHPLMGCLLTALAAQLPLQERQQVLSHAGRGLAQVVGPQTPAESPAVRLEEAVAALQQLGGLAELRPGEQPAIVGRKCPFAPIVAEHSDICQVTEALLAQLTGLSVRQVCTPQGQTQCRFHVEPTA
jgi:DeoR family transcriptional regulator, suf operon transcriptional repressor